MLFRSMNKNHFVTDASSGAYSEVGEEGRGAEAHIADRMSRDDMLAL